VSLRERKTFMCVGDFCKNMCVLGIFLKREWKCVYIHVYIFVYKCVL
jgi:hypothetical protein